MMKLDEIDYNNNTEGSKFTKLNVKYVIVVHGLQKSYVINAVKEDFEVLEGFVELVFLERRGRKTDYGMHQQIISNLAEGIIARMGVILDYQKTVVVH